MKLLRVFLFDINCRVILLKVFAFEDGYMMGVLFCYLCRRIIFFLFNQICIVKVEK